MEIKHLEELKDSINDVYDQLAAVEDTDTFRDICDEAEMLLAEMKQLVKDCYAYHEESEKEDRDIEKYGSYEDQVRDQYNSGRL